MLLGTYCAHFGDPLETQIAVPGALLFSQVTTMASERWVHETLHETGGVSFSFRADEVIMEEQTEHQHMVLFENPLFGRVMMLDGATQVTSRDEFIYHEMMVHVPMFAHGDAQDVLIVGGGDGGMAEEALKHTTLKHLTQVEIDPTVIDFAKTHFTSFNKNCFDDPRMELVVADGMVFVQETERRFDVIMVDSTDPVGPAKVLFSKDFYNFCKRCLKPGGVLVTQNGSPFFQPDELQTSVSHFASLFTDAGCYLSNVPTYIGGVFAHGWATDNVALRTVTEETVAERFAAADFSTDYYTPAIHKGCFALPRYVERLVEAGNKTPSA